MNVSAKARKRLWIALATVAVTAACGFDSNEWRGWIYPSAADNQHYFDLGAFATSDACLQAGNSILRHYSIITFRQRENPYDKGRVDCGRACKSDKGVGINACKDILRQPVR